MMPDHATATQHRRTPAVNTPDSTHPDLKHLADRLSDLCTLTDGIARLLEQASRPAGVTNWKPVEADTVRRWKQQIASTSASLNRIATAPLIDSINATMAELP